MRISVIGMGAVGGVLAALLSRAGHEVYAIARGERLVQLGKHGLQISGVAGNYLANISVVNKVASNSEIVLLSVRTFQAKQALLEQSQYIRDAAVITIQNGVRGPSQAAQILQRNNNIFGLLSTFPASSIDLKHVHFAATGGMAIAPLFAEDFPHTLHLAQQLSTAVPTSASKNLRGSLWMKLILNQVNALPAITGLSVQQVCAHPLLQHVLARSLEEAIAVCDANRIKLEQVGKLHPSHCALIRNGKALTVVTSLFGRMFGHQHNYASTLQAIKKSMQTEILDLNGEIARTGKQCRIHTPVNNELTKMVLATEHKHRFLSAHNTAKRILN